MLELGSFGEELNLLLTQGADFGPITFTVKNPDGSPVDYTGCTVRGQARTRFGKHIFTVPVLMPNPELGVYSFSIPSNLSSKLPAGLDLESPDSLHVWDLELEDSSGAITPLYYGSIRVRRKVTKS